MEQLFDARREVDELEAKNKPAAAADIFRTIATPALLNVIIIEGDNGKQAPLWGNGYTVTYGCTVLADGRASHFDSRSTGLVGFGAPELSKKDLLELMRLLHQLPDDHSQLPPPGRRLVMLSPAGGEM